MSISGTEVVGSVCMAWGTIAENSLVIPCGPKDLNWLYSLFTSFRHPRSQNETAPDESNSCRSGALQGADRRISGGFIVEAAPTCTLNRLLQFLTTPKP